LITTNMLGTIYTYPLNDIANTLQLKA